MWKLWVAVGIILVAIVGVIVVSSPDAPQEKATKKAPEMVATPMDETPPSPAVDMPIEPVKEERKLGPDGISDKLRRKLEGTSPADLLDRGNKTCKQIEMTLKGKRPTNQQEIVKRLPNYVRKDYMMAIAGCKLLETNDESWFNLTEFYKGKNNKRSVEFIKVFYKYMGIPLRAVFVEKINRQMMQQRLVERDMLYKDEVLSAFDAFKAKSIEECVSGIPSMPEAQTLCTWVRDPYSVDINSLDPIAQQMYWGVRAIIEVNPGYLSKVEREPAATLFGAAVQGANSPEYCNQYIERIIQDHCNHY